MDAILEPRATITALGSMRLSIGGVEANLSSRKALAILVYLALQPGRSESRERVAALLWSDSGGEHGRAALRQALRRVKADLGPDGDLIDGDRSVLRLTRPVALDILEALEAAGRGEPPAALLRQDADLGRLFADLEDLDPDFNLWIAVQRERLTSQLISRLEGAIAACDADARRLALAEALMRIDPTHEGACRAAMHAHLALGDTAQAMRLYERLWKVLDEELDVEPSEKTQALYVAIKQGHARPISGAPEAQEAEAPLVPVAIVVAPAEAAMLPPEIAYFRTIFRGEMIAALARFRDWLIFDGEQVATTPPAYRAYALRLMLHGREDRIVAALRLEDLGNNQCVWAERYTVTLDGLAALHRTALRQMAVALNVQLSAPRLLTARDAASPAGRRYELWMQALALASDWRAESDARAEQILRDLIASHPDFAPAMVALAQLINTRPIVYPGKTLRRARLEESLALSARAVALDPLDSRTHLCRSWSHAMAGAYSAALSHLDLALDLNENDPWTLISAGLGFAFCGEAGRALDYVAQARAFGMRHSRAATGYMVTASYLIGDYEAAIWDAEVAGDAIINLPAWAAASHIRLGQPEAAAAAIDTFLRLTRAGWAGAGEPTERSAIDWFMGCFPIRSDRVRSELAGELAAALDARKKRRP